MSEREDESGVYKRLGRGMIRSCLRSSWPFVIRIIESRPEWAFCHHINPKVVSDGIYINTLGLCVVRGRRQKGQVHKRAIPSRLG